MKESDSLNDIKNRITAAVQSCNASDANALLLQIASLVRSLRLSVADIPRANKNTPEYRAWVGLKQRCLNTKNPRYENYGGRGIKVHPDWVNDFGRFLKDVGARPSNKHSLDRINNDGNYEPGNAKWATDIEQTNNQSRSVRFTRNDGSMISLRDAVELSGLTKAAIHLRIKRLNMSIDDAMSIPLGQRIPQSMKLKGSGKKSLY